VIDTWNMTINPIDEPFTIREPKDGEYTVYDVAGRTITLPDDPWLALRITRVDN
jgi:hypothetical protein